VAVGLPGQVVDDAPDTYDRDAAVTLRCNNNEHSLLNVSRDVFTYRGPGDNESTSALATICRLERADCSAGIALHGASLGALLGTLAPRFAVGITASLMWSAGVYVAGGLSCCGLVRPFTAIWSRPHDATAPSRTLHCPRRYHAAQAAARATRSRTSRIGSRHSIARVLSRSSMPRRAAARAPTL
jgi:hypothetical protein